MSAALKGQIAGRSDAQRRPSDDNNLNAPCEV